MDNSFRTLRRLRISADQRRRLYGEKTIYPVIRLQGNWLQAAGFTPGGSVYLFIEDGVIILKTAGQDQAEAAAIELFNALNK